MDKKPCYWCGNNLEPAVIEQAGMKVINYESPLVRENLIFESPISKQELNMHYECLITVFKKAMNILKEEK